MGEFRIVVTVDIFEKLVICFFTNLTKEDYKYRHCHLLRNQQVRKWLCRLVFSMTNTSQYKQHNRQVRIRARICNNDISSDYEYMGNNELKQLNHHAYFLPSKSYLE